MSRFLGTSFTRNNTYDYVDSNDKGKGIKAVTAIGGYGSAGEFAQAIMREFNCLKSQQELLRKADSIGNTKARTTIENHYKAIQSNIEKLFDFFKTHVASEYMSGAIMEEAISTVLSEMTGMINAAIKQAERTHPLGIITTGIDKATFSLQ